jgi:hypothetical protein
MICYSCKKSGECRAFRTLYSTSRDFCINDCEHYDKTSKYQYRKIADNDDLMHLIYDYFTGQVSGDHTDEEIVAAIKSAMLDL